MSRDWTPIEHYMSEQHQLKQGHGDLFDFLENLKFVYEDGREQILNPPEEMAIRRQFPQLGRLLMDEFMELYERLSKIPGGIELLHKKDQELANLINAIVTVRDGTRYVRKIDGKNIDVDSYLVKWFTGRLDERFYYAERNNEMFVECVLSDAMALNCEPYDKEKFEAALQYFSQDVDVQESLDFFEGHANKLIYCYENKKDMLDFDFWVRYELLLGEKITWDEYVAVDNIFDGDPHDIELSHKRVIDKFKIVLKELRDNEKGVAPLDETIKAVENTKRTVSENNVVCREELSRE